MWEINRVDKKFYQMFQIKKNDIVSVTGGGGKSTLIFKLAEELREIGNVLITTTTKMYIPDESRYDNMIIYSDSLDNKMENNLKEEKNKIDILTKTKDKYKIQGIDEGVLKEYISKYDYILIEADGAKEKIIKEWNLNEPVILSISNKIIGVTNIKALGGKIKDVVHREEIYCEREFADKEDIFDVEKMKKYLLTNKFFKEKENNNFLKKKYIYINGIETLKEFNDALLLSKALQEREEENEKILMGSLFKDEIYMYQRVSAIIMASGFSRRLGQDKLLLEYNGKTLIENMMEKIDKIYFYKKKIVIPITKKTLIENMMKNDRYKTIEVVINESPEKGQSNSIKSGITKTINENKVLLREVEGYMFFPSDQPFLKIETILLIMKQFLMNNKITLPQVGIEEFSPVIFPQKYREQLLEIVGDKGGKSIIKKDDFIDKIKFKTREEFVDIDTEKELKYLQN